tara:strand:- start:1094 stop:1366 length:273 start_codon:yes stop_codon:yes gene_type:complete
MNYIFGVLLCILYIFFKILYEKIYKSNNIVNLKTYIKESFILYLSYYVLINALLYFELHHYLVLLDENSVNLSTINVDDNPLIFTNEPNF